MYFRQMDLLSLFEYSTSDLKLYVMKRGYSAANKSYFELCAMSLCLKKVQVQVSASDRDRQDILARLYARKLSTLGIHEDPLSFDWKSVAQRSCQRNCPQYH